MFQFRCWTLCSNSLKISGITNDHTCTILIHLEKWLVFRKKETPPIQLFKIWGLTLYKLYMFTLWSWLPRSPEAGAYETTSQCTKLMWKSIVNDTMCPTTSRIYIRRKWFVCWLICILAGYDRFTPTVSHCCWTCTWPNDEHTHTHKHIFQCTYLCI